MQIRNKLWGSRTRRIITVSAVLVALGGGTAFAQWILEGNGQTTSTETTGTAGSAPVVLTAGNNTDALTPGGPAGSFTLSVANNNATPVQVSSVVVSVTGTSAGAACPASWFTVTQPTFVSSSTGSVVQLPFAIPAGTSIGANGGYTGSVMPTISLNEGAPTQCENVTVDLSEVAS